LKVVAEIEKKSWQRDTVGRIAEDRKANSGLCKRAKSLSLFKRPSYLNERGKEVSPFCPNLIYFRKKNHFRVGSVASPASPEGK